MPQILTIDTSTKHSQRDGKAKSILTEVRFSILDTMPIEKIQVKCGDQKEQCGTQLLKCAESLWHTGRCTCKACKSDYSGAIPCQLEYLLEGRSASFRNPNPRDCLLALIDEMLGL